MEYLTQAMMFFSLRTAFKLTLVKHNSLQSFLYEGNDTQFIDRLTTFDPSLSYICLTRNKVLISTYENFKKYIDKIEPHGLLRNMIHSDSLNEFLGLLHLSQTEVDALIDYYITYEDNKTHFMSELISRKFVSNEKILEKLRVFQNLGNKYGCQVSIKLSKYKA